MTIKDGDGDLGLRETELTTPTNPTAASTRQLQYLCLDQRQQQPV
jgi:hypothetical protein